MPSRSHQKSRSFARMWEEWIVRPNRWWISMVVLLFLVGGGSMVLIGHHTYTDSPPMADFVDEKNRTIISHQEIVSGQVNFLKYGLMLYGSMFGDGALRGVDFSADAMHKLYLHMQEFYTKEYSTLLTGDDAIESASLRAKREMKNSAYDASKKSVTLNPAALYAYDKMVAEYSYHLRHEVSLYQPQLKNATTEELKELSAFFFWSGWVCSAKRPGYEYSYTHNWPYDKEAGNTPTSGVMLWSVLSTLGLIVVLGFVLYLHGRYSRLSGWESQMSSHSIVRTDGFTHTALQKTTYNFFLAAALLFVLQVAAGILSVHNYVGFGTIFGFDVGSIMSLITARSWHLQLGTLWITACWIGISIFLASQGTMYSRRQLLLAHTLFLVFLIMTLGILIGLVVPLEKLAQNWNFFGNQGWEFVEMGKLWQWMMLSVFVLWSSLIFTLIYPRWSRKKAWNLPNWLFYCILSISLLFLSAFVAKPETNFVIADFWRWAVIHMWVEAFFEVFATIVIVYMMHLMGFLSQAAASRIVYLAALLFLGTGLLGISHNFYWNAKPIATLALGSIFSTLQVVPLILVALEAWKFRNLPNAHIQRDGIFSQKVAFAFLLGVNFWNFLGAGVFGFIINLPIVNYYEHGTYLTVNHGHAAFMGVYGNLSIGAMLFVSRYLLKEEFWNEKLLLRIFWSINIGLALMVVMDLFPAGLHQLIATMDHGLWYARSEAFIQTDTFQFLTFSRMVGGLVFVFGGVLPLAYFIIKSRSKISTQKPLLF